MAVQLNEEEQLLVISRLHQVPFHSLSMRALMRACIFRYLLARVSGVLSGSQIHADRAVLIEPLMEEGSPVTCVILNDQVGCQVVRHTHGQHWVRRHADVV